MAIVTDKIKSVVDFLVKGFEPRETIFDDMAEDDMEGGYDVQDNLAIDPAYSYQPKVEKLRRLKLLVIQTSEAVMKLELWNPVHLMMQLKSSNTLKTDKQSFLIFTFLIKNSLKELLTLFAAQLTHLTANRKKSAI